MESIADYMDANAKMDLSWQFRGRIIRDYAIPDFLRNVWRLDASFLEGMKDGDIFCMNEELAEKFVREMWEKTFTKSGVRVEGGATAAFEQLWNDLGSMLHPTSRSEFVPIRSMHDSNIRSTHVKYKPEFITSPLDRGTQQRWNILIGCGVLTGKQSKLKIDQGKLAISAGDLHKVSTLVVIRCKCFH